jgi:hypothetical protein
MSQRLRAFRLRLAALLRGRSQQDDYDEELAFHQHMLRERLEREGTPAQQLDTATRRIFGKQSRWREQLSELRQFSRLENILRDLAYATRLLRKSLGFTLTAILTIALGIGASTAIFSLINALLLRPLPVPDAHHLVVLDYHEDNDAHGAFCAPLFRHLERDHAAFSDIFASSATQLQVGVSGGSTLVSAVLVSGQYFAPSRPLHCSAAISIRQTTSQAHHLDHPPLSASSIGTMFSTAIRTSWAGSCSPIRSHSPSWG